RITVTPTSTVAEVAHPIPYTAVFRSSFAAEVTRVAKEVGTEGKLGGQAEVKGVSGTWKDLTDNVNGLAGNLTAQVRNIAKVTTRSEERRVGQKITVEAKEELLKIKDKINKRV